MFEEEIHQTIISGNLFSSGETVAIGASGGKDSTVLAYIMKLLNEKYDYGLNLVLYLLTKALLVTEMIAWKQLKEIRNSIHFL
ncbi:CTU1 [Bugula neritina]|uniref:CTU1 n=1 Tax=Bugula neritina TaxID=10212 RepID=A0A7J7JDL4_BUGNE|nr:CTU1 [Bugula neritina]